MLRALLLLAALCLAPDAAGGFILVDSGSVATSRRWNAEDYRGTGLHDGLQVAVEPGFAEALGALPEEVELVRDAVRAAFAAWESPVLVFEIEFDGPATAARPFAAPRPGEGLEIDVFAVHAGQFPFGESLETVGGTWVSSDFVEDRLLTSGQRLGGNVISGADVYINIEGVQAAAASMGLDRSQQIDALQRLLMNQIGVALGFFYPFQRPNIDADDDPTNAMPVDGCAFFAGLAFREGSDARAVMNQDPPDPADLLRTTLRPDDIAGRDVLYPVPPASGCDPLPPFPGPARLLDEQGAGPDAPLLEPSALELAPDGTLFVAGRLSNNVLRVDPDGAIQELLD